MNATRLISHIGDAPASVITSTHMFAQGVRDQNGVVTFRMSGGTFGLVYSFEIQGAAIYEGASTKWTTLAGSSDATGNFSDFILDNLAGSIDFPLMPVMRVVFDNTNAAHTTLEAWVVE